MNEKEWVVTEAQHYKMALEAIVAIGADYDGYSPDSSVGMKKLVDELVELSKSAINLEPVYLKENEPGKMIPSYVIKREGQETP